MTRNERRHPERKRRIYYRDGEKDKLKRTAFPYPERRSFRFFLFSSHIFLFSSHSKAFFYSLFGSIHHPQKLKRMPASILHLLETSAPKFLV